jgi:hypothetical protein
MRWASRRNAVKHGAAMPGILLIDDDAAAASASCCRSAGRVSADTVTRSCAIARALCCIDFTKRRLKPSFGSMHLIAMI